MTAQKEIEKSRIKTKSLLDNGICQDLSKITSVDDTVKMTIEVLDFSGDFSTYFEQILEDFDNRLELIHGAIEDFNSLIDLVEFYANSISWIMITMLILTCILLIGGLLACFGLRLKAFFIIQGWIILPLFMTSLVLSILLTCVCAIILVFFAGKLLHQHFCEHQVQRKCIHCISSLIDSFIHRCYNKIFALEVLPGILRAL